MAGFELSTEDRETLRPRPTVSLLCAANRRCSSTWLTTPHPCNWTVIEICSTPSQTVRAISKGAPSTQRGIARHGFGPGCCGPNDRTRVRSSLFAARLGIRQPQLIRGRSSTPILWSTPTIAT